LALVYIPQGPRWNFFNFRFGQECGQTTNKPWIKGTIMSDNCCEHTQKIMLLACSGGSKLGQLSNRAAVELTKEGLGELFCLAGIGANISGFVQSAKDVGKLVVIDGCEKACGKAILENAGVHPDKHIVVAQLNIKESNNLDLKSDDLAQVKHAVKLALKYPIKVSFDSPKPLSAADKARSKMFEKRCC
jgi:uncharacterized metal-binding protein